MVALLRVSNKLVYPGTLPGINPAHPAAQGLVSRSGFSIVPVGGQWIELNSAKPFTVVFGSPTGKFDGLIGPGRNYGANDGDLSPISLNQLSITPNAITSAFIIRVISVGGAYAGFISLPNGSGNWLPTVLPSNNFGCYMNGNLDSTIPAVAGTPYFVAISAYTSLKINFVVKNLATGAVRSNSISSNATSSVAGAYYIGNNNGSQGALSLVAAAMTSYTYLSVAQLLAWADDPWSFWYPRNLDLSFLLRAPPGGAPTGTLAATEAKDTAAFNASYVVAGTLATTEAPDVAAFNGTVAVSGTLATTEATDSAAFNGNAVVSGAWTSTESPDTAVFNGNTVASGSFAVTEGQDTAAFVGSGIVSGTWASTEAADTAAFAGNSGVSGSLSATTAQDVAAFAGNFGISGTLAVTEGADLAVFVGQFGIPSGTLAANDNADIAAFTGSATGAPSGSLSVTELPDNVVFLIDYMAPPSVTAPSPYPSPFDYGWSYGEPPLRPGMPGSGTGRSS